jgi:hypothetical protein
VERLFWLLVKGRRMLMLGEPFINKNGLRLSGNMLYLPSDEPTRLSKSWHMKGESQVMSGDLQEDVPGGVRRMSRRNMRIYDQVHSTDRIRPQGCHIA